jgi:hypothetical protein
VRRDWGECVSVVCVYRYQNAEIERVPGVSVDELQECAAELLAVDDVVGYLEDLAYAAELEIGRASCRERV